MIVKRIILGFRKRVVYHIIRFRLLRKKNFDLTDDTQSLDVLWNKAVVHCYLPKTNEVRRKKGIDLSLIIPLYNSEKFIDKLIICLVKQNTRYKYEIILIDDGSTDNTAKIVSKYLNDYKDKIVFKKKKNGGISSARNVGLKLAKGKYIGFLDHDDLISDEYVEKLLNIAYRNNADIVKCGTVNFRNGKELSRDCAPTEKIVGKMGEKILNYPSLIWAGVYKRELMKGVYFPESYWYEDMITRFLLYRRSKLFINTSEGLYYRNHHSNQASKKVWSNKKYKCLEQLYLIEQLVRDNMKNSMDNDLWLYLNVLLECSTIMVKRIDGLDDEVKRQVFLRVNRLLDGLYNKEYEKQLKGEWKVKSDVILKKRYDLWQLEKYL